MATVFGATKDVRDAAGPGPVATMGTRAELRQADGASADESRENGPAVRETGLCYWNRRHKANARPLRAAATA